MAGNNRVLYAIESLAIGPYCTQSGLAVHGVQSVGTTTTFNLDNVFELGQLDIYQSVEDIPNIEMNIEKDLDGYPLIYHLATRGATSKTLLNRTNQRADVIFNIFSDGQVSASGTPLSQVYCSGMYVNSLSYKLPIRGACTETVGLVGNDKIWYTSGFANTPSFNNLDNPASGIMIRQNVVMGAAPTGSIWPTQIPGMTVVSGSGYNNQASNVFGAHLQEVSITCNLGRTDLYELGRRRPYYRYANFPTAVDCTINVTLGGTTPGDLISANADANNLVAEPIKVVLSDATIFDLGTKNKLKSVTYSGGDTSGGVASVTYSYQNFNFLSITDPSDPEGLT